MVQTCLTCPRKIKGNCKKCGTCCRTHNRRTKPKSYLTQVYSGITLRCKNTSAASNVKYYYGKSFCTRSEFINRFLNDGSFLELYRQWQDSGFVYKLSPSIDRIDKTKDYEISNLQFITHSENAGKDKEKLPILMFDLNGVFIKEFESKWAAHKELNIPNGNICKVVYGKRRSAGGFIFKFKT